MPFQVDDIYEEPVSYHSWHVDYYGYVTTSISRYPSRCIRLMLHEFLFGKLPKGCGLEWDHVNRDKTDCRVENMRKVTSRINQRNKAPSSQSKTGVRGVSYYRTETQKDRWVVVIAIDGKSKFRLGVFKNFKEAVLARYFAELEHWGHTIINKKTLDEAVPFNM